MIDNEIFLFGNSASYYTPKGKSYSELLIDHYKDKMVGGVRFSAMTIWHVKKYYRHHIRGEGCWIILHVGVTEAGTRNAMHFINYWLRHVLAHGNDSFYDLIIQPKMFQCAEEIDRGEETYHPIIDVSGWTYLYEQVLNALLPSFRVIVVGIGNPKEPDHRVAACSEYTLILRDLAQSRGAHYIDVFNNCVSCDESHMGSLGHQIVFEEIRGKIG